MSTATRRRQWFAYGCGGVLMVVLVAAITLVVTYRAWRGRRQAQQRAAAQKVEALGGWVQHSFSSANPFAIWLESGDAPNIFSLSDRGLADDDFRFLAEAPTTRGLTLFNNRLTDSGLAHLADLHELETLDLRRNPAITDEGLVHLEKLKNLKTLYLMGTGVTSAGVSNLQAKLPGATIRHSAGR